MAWFGRVVTWPVACGWSTGKTLSLSTGQHHISVMAHILRCGREK